MPACMENTIEFSIRLNIELGKNVKEEEKKDNKKAVTQHNQTSSPQRLHKLAVLANKFDRSNRIL